MTRIEFWDRISKVASWVDNKLDPKSPYLHRAENFVNKLAIADSRIRLAIYVGWLAIRGDTVFFDKYEARHRHGIDRYKQNHKNEDQRINLLAAAELEGDRNLREELGALIIKNRRQASEIRNMQEAAERRNIDLAALHIVWCDGGCPGGVGTPETLDREVVLRAVHSVNRPVNWWNSNQYKNQALTEDYLREKVNFEPPVVEK